MSTDTNHATFRSMDESTQEDWQAIILATMQNQYRVAESILFMLNSLKDITDGFLVDQLTHCLQTATRAEKDGAGEELVLASLVHDVGKFISVINHPAIAAEMIRPYVSSDIYHVIRTHQDFQGKHYYQHLGMSQTLRDNHKDEPWYETAVIFADEWDQKSFDPDYESYSLDHFVPLVTDIFSKARSL